MCAVPCIARDKTGVYTVVGIGTTSCGTVVTQLKTEIGKVVIGSWVSGYMTSVNNQVASRKDVTAGTDPEARILWINNHCMANPLNSLNQATLALLAELSKGPE